MGKVIGTVCTITDQLIRTRPICPNCKYEHTERSYKKSAGGMKMKCADCGEPIIIGSPKHKKIVNKISHPQKRVAYFLENNSNIRLRCS